MNLKNLIPWKPHQLSAWSPRERSPVDSFRREMDRLFDEFWGDALPARWGRMAEGFWPDKAKATFRKGVLRVSLPKTPEAQAQRKTIPVQAG